MGVTASFDRSGVVARGEHDGGDAVHDALVVCRRPVRVRLGEGAGGDDVVDDLRAAEELRVEDAARTGEPQLRLVREDAQKSARLRDFGDARGDRLSHRVDGVRAHRIPHVDVQVDDDLGARARREHPHRDIQDATAERDEHGVLLVGEGTELVAGLQQPQPRRERVDGVENLYLGDHDVAGG